MSAIGFPELIIIAIVVLVGVSLYRRRKQGAPGPSEPTDDKQSAQVLETPSQPTAAAAAPAAHVPVPPTEPAAYIFLSYASSDRDAAQRLAEALSQRGWKVWWDRSILPGATFDKAIETALDRARCVIVLWSSTSVESDWVKTEAAEGARRRVLIPALLEDVTIPLEFRRIQGAHLAGWSASLSGHQGFDSLVRAVAEQMGPSPVQTV